MLLLFVGILQGWKVVFLIFMSFGRFVSRKDILTYFPIAFSSSYDWKEETHSDWKEKELHAMMELWGTAILSFLWGLFQLACTLSLFLIALQQQLPPPSGNLIFIYLPLRYNIYYMLLLLLLHLKKWRLRKGKWFTHHAALENAAHRRVSLFIGLSDFPVIK